MVGVILFLAAVVIIGIIKLAGKRKLGVTAMFGSALACTGTF